MSAASRSEHKIRKGRIGGGDKRQECEESSQGERSLLPKDGGPRSFSNEYRTVLQWRLTNLELLVVEIESSLLICFLCVFSPSCPNWFYGVTLELGE